MMNAMHVGRKMEKYMEEKWLGSTATKHLIPCPKRSDSIYSLISKLVLKNYQLT